jgi:hypothetical protein
VTTLRATVEKTVVGDLRRGQHNKLSRRDIQHTAYSVLATPKS